MFRIPLFLSFYFTYTYSVHWDEMKMEMMKYWIIFSVLHYTAYCIAKSSLVEHVH